jgi:hypothetical protein
MRGVSTPTALLLLVALLVSACGSDNPPVEFAAESSAAGSTETVVAIEVASGPDAIAAAQGTAHILWFWGAN